MPYTIDSPPAQIENLPAHAQEIWVSAFNSAYEQYDGDEEKAHAAAWAAVKNKYKQVDGKWIAREAKESLSLENQRQKLQAAVAAKFGKSTPTPEGGSAYVEDVTDTEVIFNQGGQTFKATYRIDDENVELGEPVKVVRQTVYVNQEAVHAAYAELIAEAGLRNDVSCNIAVRELASQLRDMEAENTPQADIDALMVRIQKTTEDVKKREIVSIQEGQNYPAAAFAYVPDPRNPATWKLRLWEGAERRPNQRQMGIASASLSPGGYRGIRSDIPDYALPFTRYKLREAYRSLGVPDEDMPKWVKEVSMKRVPIAEFNLQEAASQAKGRGMVVIIKPGFNESKGRYYPREVLARDYKVFEGNKMFADHPTAAEEAERPERSIKDFVATLDNVRVRDSDGALVGDYTVIDPAFESKMAKLRDAGKLDRIGVSINAIGAATRQEVDTVETDFIEKLIASRSVDFVTEPGAGGRVEIFESKDPSLDVDLVDAASFKARRPDIVKEIEEAVRNEFLKEAKRKVEDQEKIKTLETENQTLKTSNETLLKENDGLKQEKSDAEKAKAKAEVQARIKEAVNKAELPDPAKARLLESLKDSESDANLQEAINQERDYVARLEDAGKVKGMGGTPPEKTAEKVQEGLKESFKASGMSEKEAEIAARGR